MTRLSRVVGIGLLMAFPLGVQAADAGRFTLGKAVPAEAYIYVHGVHNPERAYAEKYWGEVWKAFKDAGVVEEVRQLIVSDMAPPERADFEKFWSKATELIKGVDWQARVEEVVYTGRMGAPIPEYLFLVRYEQGKAAKNADAFAAVLKEIASAVGDETKVRFAADAADGGKVSTLSFPQAPFINFRVGLRGDVVAVAVDRTLMEEAFAALGPGGKPGLIESDRYKKAIGKLPPAEDSVMFFDVKATIDGVRGIFQWILTQTPAANDPNAAEVMRVMGKVLDELAMFDYIASTGQTDGYKQVAETIVALSPDAEKSRLYKVFKPEQVEKFDRFIPKEATAYSVCSGFDLGALYAAVLDFIDKEVPNGTEILGKWEQVQQHIGFNPQRDVFAWLGSQFTVVTLPSAAPTAFSSSDSVLFVKVRDEKKAAETVKRGLDKLNDFLTSKKQPLTSQPAGIEGAEGFRMVTHPMVMIFFRPVYGVANGHLVIGTSPKAIEACLATARGERPGVAQNERVMKEGLIPKGPVSSASFEDLTTMGQEIAGVLNVLGFVSAMIPDEPQAKPVKGLIGILGKLGPVAEKIDFLRSTSSVSTFEGQAWRSRTVINYRPPVEKPAPAQRSGT